jgi:hypothetical protein
MSLKDGSSVHAQKMTVKVVAEVPHRELVEFVFDER